MFLSKGSTLIITSGVMLLNRTFFMSNPASAIRLKRRLDRGDDSDLLDQKLVLGRIGLASPQDCQKANSAAREACGVWAQRSRKFREQIVVAMHNRIVERSQEYIMSLVNDGHPRNLAAWEVSGVIAGGGQGMFDVLSAFMGFSIETPIGLNQVERRPDGVVAIVLPRNAAGANAAMALPILAARKFCYHESSSESFRMQLLGFFMR